MNVLVAYASRFGSTRGIVECIADKLGQEGTPAEARPVEAAGDLGGYDAFDRDRDLALDRARELLTQYLGQQPHIMKASGVDPGLDEEVGKVMTWPAGPEEIRRAMRLVPDDAVQSISASGSPEECKAKVREYVANGATCPVLYRLATMSS